MAKRPAHTFDVLKRSFAAAEAGTPTPMELFGLYDELQRIERKWRLQHAEESERRSPEDIDKLNDWFDRLQRLIERAARSTPADPTLTGLLEKLAARSRRW